MAVLPPTPSPPSSKLWNYASVHCRKKNHTCPLHTTDYFQTSNISKLDLFMGDKLTQWSFHIFLVLGRYIPEICKIMFYTENTVYLLHMGKFLLYSTTDFLKFLSLCGHSYFALISSILHKFIYLFLYTHSTCLMILC